MCAGDDAGFTLVEVLVALAILSLGLAAVLQSVSSGLAAAARAEDKVRLTLEAQSRMAAIGIDTPQVLGRQTGGGENGRWEVDVAVAEPGLALVTVTVSGARSSVRLTTLRPLAGR